MSPATQVLLDGIGPAPALVLGRRTDILAWNPMAAALLLDFAELPEERRTLIRLVFLEPRMRRLYPRWRQIAAEAVARLRMEAVKYPDDPRLAGLVDELSARDDDFRRWWGGHQVKAVDSGRKCIRHPVAGLLTIDWQALSVIAEQDQTLVVYTAPPESRSGQALRSLEATARGGSTRSPC